MATATMGLRRRVHQVSTTSSTPGTSSSTSTSSGSSGSGASSSHSGAGKRTRSDNNNSPSQGNLNSPEPAPKKARNSSRVAAARAKELEMAKKVAPPHWSDTRQFASIAGLSLQDQQALCSNALPSPVSYLSSQMATFVGNAAASLGKGPAAGVSYLDISNMTAGPGPRPNWPSQDASTADPISLAFSAAAAFPSTSKSNSSCGPAPSSATSTSVSESAAASSQPVGLPKNFPNDAMFGTYQPWVIKTYGDLAKTKTITIKKYARILRTLRGEEVNSAENSKFRFWVKSKGFHIGQPEGYEAKPADRIIGRHAVSTPGLDPPLYVPTQPPHNKALNGAEGTVPPGRIYKKVAIVENFFDIIHAVHVDLEGRPGKHAGQKRTYRTITETYAFLPREAVTRFLLGCTECQRRPRTPSPTTTAATIATASSSTTKSDSPSPIASPSPPTPEEKKEEPASPKPASVAAGGVAKDVEASREIPNETSAATESKSGLSESEDVPQGPKGTETITAPVSSTTLSATTTPSLDTKKSMETDNNNSSSSNVSSSEIKPSTEVIASLASNNGNEAAKSKVRDEKYNPLSITNLLRKDPVKRRSPPIITTAYQPFPTSDAYAYTMTATTAMNADNRGSPCSTYIRKIHSEDGLAASAPMTTAATSASPWSPGKLESKYSAVDYSRSLIPEAQTKPQSNTESARRDGGAQSWATSTMTSSSAAGIATTATVAAAVSFAKAQLKSLPCESSDVEMDEKGSSPTTGLIDTNLNLLATIQQLHCQVMLALTERLRPAVSTSPAATDS